MATNPRMLIILTAILLSVAIIPNAFAVTDVSNAFQIFFSDSSDKLLSREYPDLKIETINLNRKPVVGEAVTITARIRNNGKGSANVIATLPLLSVASELEGNLNTANGLPTRDVFGNPLFNNELKPADIVDLKVIWIPKKDVLQKINLDIDSANAIPESNELNNGGTVASLVLFDRLQCGQEVIKEGKNYALDNYIFSIKSITNTSILTELNGQPATLTLSANIISKLKGYEIDLRSIDTASKHALIEIKNCNGLSDGITGGVVASRDCTTRNLKTGQAIKVHGNNIQLNAVQATGGFSEYAITVEINDKPYTITKKFGLLGVLETDEDVSIQVSTATDSVSNLHDAAALSICAKPRF